VPAMSPNVRRRRIGGLTVAFAIAVALTIVGLAHPVEAAPKVFVVAGDDPNVTGDQWGLHESYYSELRATITDPANFGASGTVNAIFTIGTPRATPLTSTSLNGIDVYFLSARDIADSETTVLQSFVRRGGALVVSSNAPYFFDDTAWLGFTLSPRVVYGDGAAPYDTTHRAPSPSKVVATEASSALMKGPFGTITTFENWHTVAGFSALPAAATALARTTLTGPDDNGSASFITITDVATLATIPAGALGAGSGPVIATSDVDTFSNAYTAGIGYATDTLSTLNGTTNGTLARNAFAWIAAQKGTTPTSTTTTSTSTTSTSTTSTTTTTTKVPPTTTSTTTTRPVTKLSLSPTTVRAGSNVTVTWSAISGPTSKDWIGLYQNSGAANTAYLTRRNTTGSASGSVSFTVPVTTAAGSTYELRLFTNNTFTRLATSTSFAVAPRCRFFCS
jgi:hypothetical protein